MRKILFLLFALAALLVSCSGDSGMPCVTCDAVVKQPNVPSEPEFDDGSCDIGDYTFKQIDDTHLWLTKNLNCRPINSTGFKCYNNKPINCHQYGTLYDFKTAKIACDSLNRDGVTGWRLPTKEEWATLIEFVESSNDCEEEGCAAKYLKSKTSWAQNGNGEDAYEFAALPGGKYSDSDGYFYEMSYVGYWWSASDYSALNAYGQSMALGDNSQSEHYYDKNSLLSVRCIRDFLPDVEEEPEEQDSQD